MKLCSHRCAVSVLSLMILFGKGYCFETAAEDELLEIYGGEEGLSIATGNYIPVHLAPAVASVITARDIERSGATNITQVLERVPGLHMYLSQLGRMHPYYSIRGIHTDNNSQVLILLNGLEVPFLFTGSRENFYLPVQYISRIEVLRGPGSAVYGADAFAGVINIITKDQREISALTFGIKGGNFNDHEAWLQYGSELHDWGFSFTYEDIRTGGDPDRKLDSDLQTQLDAGFGTTASLAPGQMTTGYRTQSFFANANHQYVDINLWFNDIRNIEMPAGAAHALDYDGHSSDTDHLFDMTLSTDDLWDGMELSLRGSYHRFEARNYYKLLPDNTMVLVGSDGNLFTPGANGPGGGPVVAMFPDGVIGAPNGLDHSRRLELVFNVTKWQHHNLRASLGYKNHHEETSERKNFGPGILDEVTIGQQDELMIVDGQLTDVSGTDDVFSRSTSRRVKFASIQDEWGFLPDWTLTAGIRYDRYSDFGSTSNPRLALVWQADYNLTVKWLYGEAFRAPSFDTLYAQNNPVNLGNPELTPEKIKVSELVVNYKPTFELSTQVNFFDYRVTDLIDYLPASTGLMAQNARSQDGYGLEAEVTWEPNHRLQMHANYAWQHSEDAETGVEVADAPQQQFYANVNWSPYGDWNLYGQFNWVMDRARDKDDLRSDIDDFRTVDISVQNNNVFSGIKLGLTVQNLFNEDIRMPSAYDDGSDNDPTTGNVVLPGDIPTEGRHYIVEMRYSF